MCSFKSIYFVIFILNLYAAYAQISDKRLCVDPECKEPVSLAKTLLRYSSPDPRLLSFAPNVAVTIYSKEAGSETSLWGAEIKGKRGYVPKNLVREQKVYKVPKLLVDTELKRSSQVPKETDQNIDPNSVKKAYEVVDGTTIYLNPHDSVNPSSTESPVLSTSLPIASDNSVTEQQTVSEDILKEKDVPKTVDELKSVVNSDLSSFSTLTDDDDSEEIDAEGDEEEDEEEEDEEESVEDIEADKKLAEDIKNTNQDINTLHNLPEGMKVSRYNLEIDQPLNGTIEMKNEEASVQSEPTVFFSSSDKGQEPEVKEKIKDIFPQDIKNREPVIPSLPTINKEPIQEKEAEEKSATPKTEVIQSDKTESSTVVPETVEQTKQNETETIQQPNSETINNVDTNPKNADVSVVTEPSTAVEEEQFPSIEDVTTSIPLDVEQNNVKIEEIATNVPPQETEEEKKVKKESSTETIDIPSVPKSTSEEATTLIPEVVTESSPSSSNSVENQEPIPKEKSSSFIPLSPLGIFNPMQNAVSEESKETENADKASEDVLSNAETSENKNDGASVSSETSEEVEENIPSQVPDISKNDVQNVGGDQIESIQLPESVQTASKPEEVADGNLEQEEINIDDKEDKHEEESKSVFKEELQSDDTNNIAEPPPQDSIEGVPEESGGMWSGLFSFFGGDQPVESNPNEQPEAEKTIEDNAWTSQSGEVTTEENYCDVTSESCNTSQLGPTANFEGIFDNITMKFSSDFFLLLITTAGSVIVFLFVYMVLDKHRKEAPLVARINKLEKELLVTLKENELLQEKGISGVQEIESVPNDVVEQLTQRLAEAQFSQRALEEKIVDLEQQLEAKNALEEQIESLEKELETSTEVGMELNRIISEMLDPTNGSDRLKENVEQLQRQLLEQKDVINSISETLRERESENRALRSDLDRSKKAAAEFQGKVDELVEKILKIEKEKDQQQLSLQNEITVYQQKYNEAISRVEILANDNQIIRLQLSEAQRQADIKTKEYQTLKESLDKMKPLKNNSEALKALLDSTSIRAEIQQLKSENAAYAAQLQQEQAIKVGFEKKYQATMEEINSLKEKYEKADKEKLEVNSKLEVLNNYFKKRESELQEEIIRYKSIWDAKEGEATSTTERMRHLQEEIENYKAQNETLKQEIISQEIDLKSQISVLEKKVHENWVTARQTERKLEDARQEAAQLRNRLTLRERAINEERIQNRLQSPVEQNGELPLSPHPIDSPPLLYGARDHITKSPPLPGLPPHFLPPPPGAPFMPPPLHGMPPFMPPPPSMFPGDHRPPPLGRMSSPPLNSRYSPDSSAFSPYDRNSPSPPYDSEYGASPPPMRGYSPYNSRDDRRDYKRPPHARTNGRNAKGAVMSSGSDHSNDSLDKLNRKQSKMV